MQESKEGKHIFMVTLMDGGDFASFNKTMAKFEGLKRNICFGMPRWLISCTSEEEVKLVCGDSTSKIRRMSTCILTTDKEEALEMATMEMKMFILEFGIDNLPAVRNLVAEGYSDTKKLLKYPPSEIQYEKMGFNVFQQNVLTKELKFISC